MSRTLPELTDATLTLENRVATLTLNRHDVRNALTGTALVDDIIATAAWVNRCQDVSVLVITGTGSAFCAGGNVKDMAERSGDFAGDVAEVAERYRQGIQRMPLALNQVEVPIIAAVNGAAIGAGFDLANMADLRIASRKASFGETFLNLGIIPGDGGAWERLCKPSGEKLGAPPSCTMRSASQSACCCSCWACSRNSSAAMLALSPSAM